jgi:uncharacterized protein (DUF2141 family)
MRSAGGEGRAEGPDLLLRCERALAAAARAARAGTRQQVRAAARRFVRHHRRNGSYLAFVLRSVLANSALAVLLLGLAPSPGHARGATLFTEITGTASPVHGLLPGNGGAPAVGDLDGDGKLDLLVGNAAGTFIFYKNTGSATAPAFLSITGTGNPLNGVDVGVGSAPALADLDGNGTLDLVSGNSTGTFLYYKNIGSKIAPTFALQTGTNNPFNGIDVGTDSAPTLADLDGNGTLDLVAGNVDGTFAYYKNIGSATAPQFQSMTGTNNPLNGVQVQPPGFGYSRAIFADLDGDGDLDLIVGERYGGFLYFENTGFRTQPAFVQRVGIANPLAGVDIGYTSFPALGDFDGDGDFDLVAGDTFNELRYFENLGTDLVERTGSDDPISGLGPLYRTAPAFADLDGDGDLDMITGESGGTFVYAKNTGPPGSPAYAAQTGTNNPLNGQVAGFGKSMPALGDLDGDGLVDMISGESTGTLLYFKNTGTSTGPAFTPITGTANPLNGQDVGTRSAPALGDVDGDGDLDLVVGRYTGTFAYYKNIGSSGGLPIFSGPLTGTANPFNGLTTPHVYSSPTLKDIDGDGDLDLVAGDFDGNFSYFENTGSATAPAFVQRTGSANPLDGVEVGGTNNYSTPALADLDQDGDFDVVSGSGEGGFFFYENTILRPTPIYLGPNPIPFAGKHVASFSTVAAGDLDGDGDPDFVATEEFASGTLHYFQNTGSVTKPQVVEITGTANPFDGLSAGFTPRLVLVDIDGDGDLDLVSGENYLNPLHYFENTGTATSPAFVERTGTALPHPNPFAGVIVGRGSPTFGDIDHDGDLDLVVGEFNGTFHYFRNDGTARAPLFGSEITGTANPFNGLSAGNFATAALGDVDRDGDLDLVAGEESPGIFHYYENTGTATSPAYVERTGTANPLNGKNVGLDSVPTLVDLDGDGDLDVVSGERYGTFPTYYMPEPSASAMLGAGAGLLAWLGRWRRRRRSPR